jgi:hypothetical protein
MGSKGRRPARKPPRNTPALTAPATPWFLTDHVCRECLGRILISADIGSFRCAECGIEGTNQVEEICACGCRLKDGSDAEFRCTPNPQRSPDLPTEIAVVRTPANRRPGAAVHTALPLRRYGPPDPETPAATS